MLKYDLFIPAIKYVIIPQTPKSFLKNLYHESFIANFMLIYSDHKVGIRVYSERL